MRILFLSDNFWPESNAPATRLHEHGSRWAEAGHDVTVITCAPNFPDGEVFDGYRNCWVQTEEVAGIRVVRVKTYIAANQGMVKRTLDFLSFMVAGTIRGFFEPRPDLVVATSPQFFAAVAGWLVALRHQVPFVFEVRDLWPASIVAVGAMRKGAAIRLLERLELFLYQRASRVICLTEAFRRDLEERGVAPAKIDVVLNGVDLSSYRPREEKDPDLIAQLGLDDRFVVGYLGTHGRAHGLESVIEAATLLEERSDIAFLFAGAGAEKEKVHRLVEKRNLSSVSLLPMQPKQRMPALWSVCDAALVPLRDTSVFRTVIPSKMFEAIGMGVPLLMSVPAGEATALVEKTGVGLCVPPEDPEALAAAVRRMQDEPGLMANLRRACITHAPEFSRDRLADDMLRSFAAAIRPETPVTADEGTSRP